MLQVTESKTINLHPIALTGSTLKLIAVISMLLDHIGAIVIENGILRGWEETQLLAFLETEQGKFWMGVDFLFRTAGRLAFPIFCFLLVEGFLHTRNVKRYAGMMFLFAILSEIPFDLAARNRFFDVEFQNVYFTLFLGLIMMICLKKWGGTFWKQAAIVTIFCGIAVLLRCDYDMAGILIIACFYLFRGRRSRMFWSAGLLSFMESLMCFGAAALALIPISCYNGERGRLRSKYFFYCFYPVHLLLLFLFNWIVLGVGPVVA